MHARVVLGVGKVVPLREGSPVQGCPYRGVPLCNYTVYLCIKNSCVKSVQIQ